MPVKPLGLEKKSQGGVASGASFSNPPLICFPNKSESLLPDPMLPDVLLGTRKPQGQEPNLNSTRQATPFLWTMHQESGREDGGEAQKAALVSLGFVAAGS